MQHKEGPLKERDQRDPLLLYRLSSQTPPPFAMVRAGKVGKGFGADDEETPRDGDDEGPPSQEEAAKRIQARARGMLARRLMHEGLPKEHVKLLEQISAEEARRQFDASAEAQAVGQSPLGGAREELMKSSISFTEVLGASKYLHEQNLADLFRGLLSRVLLHRPTDVRSFLLKELEAMRGESDAAFKAQPPHASVSSAILTRQDASALFGMLDPLRSGFAERSLVLQLLCRLEPATEGEWAAQCLSDAVERQGARGTKGKITEDMFERALEIMGFIAEQ
ncbi:unnamed protein product [Vitrella brassicaformis CCMP3155]|uniref:Uncharacterized protein n=1 Tax=Vitrella brassicaformis (strain CCMP3155) TaxID=1169540 RepID=A0A0G4FKG6_VITBC|nr:unnamed protein product [Vitrella brassicaformis CCMP3155]|eukprot:CEM14070.1 unnamed protein product [Vitrella brassicaformis CCMP3155]